MMMLMFVIFSFLRLDSLQLKILLMRVKKNPKVTYCTQINVDKPIIMI